MTQTGVEAPVIADPLANHNERLISDFDLAFLEPGVVNALREAQFDPVEQAGIDAVQALTPRQALKRGNIARDRARERATQESVNTHIAAHVPEAWLTEFPELQELFANILSRYSYHNMTAEEWYLGLPDNSDPDANTQRPGQERLVEEVNALRAIYGAGETTTDENNDETNDDDDETELDPSLELTPEDIATYNNARDTLARLSIERRQLILKHGPKAARLEAAYKEARDTFRQLGAAVSTARVEQLRRRGVGEPAIQEIVARATRGEHQHFSNKEYDLMMDDTSKRARVARWLAQHPKLLFGTEFVSGIFVGGAAKAAIAGVAGVTAGIFLPGVIGTALAVGSTKGVLTAAVGNRAETLLRFNQRRNEDHAALTRLLDGIGNQEGDSDTDNIATRAQDIMQAIIDGRVEQDRAYNFKRALGHAAVGAAGGLLGELGTVGFQHLVGGVPHVTAQAPAKGSINVNHIPGVTQQPIGPSIHQPVTLPQPGVPAGLQPNIHVPQGAGYDQVLTSLAAEQGAHLNGAQSWLLYNHLQGIFGKHIFANNLGYVRGPGVNNLGISHAGLSQWSPGVAQATHNWLIQHNLLSDPVKKAAKKTAKATGHRVLTLAGRAVTV